MAERPIFIPKPNTLELVKEVFLRLTWHPGFARVQKEKNIAALHLAAVAEGYKRVLEVSTKSASKRGRHLSAFYLKVKTQHRKEILLESAFQGSKVFELGGPFTDIYDMDAAEAKKDKRLKESGRLIAFEFDGKRWPLEPTTAFYDWLYIRCIYPHREWASKLYVYDGFSDIEFNPSRSINCQARSIALFLSLKKSNQLDEAIQSPDNFIRVLRNSAYHPHLHKEQLSSANLFPASE
jgi:hypothetical protein